VTKKGVIHDLGYARYSGERRPPSTLWRVIMRQHLAHAWKTLWRLKVWVLVAVIITVVFGVILAITKTGTMGMVTAAAGKNAPTWLTSTIPYAYKFYRIPAFLVTMTVGAAIIARDREIGAFTFYFSRPVRSLDYVVGKVAGQLVLIAVIFLAGPFVLSVASVAMAQNTTEMLKQLWIIPKTLAIGTLVTLAYTTVPLAFSAVSPRRTIALTFWAGYYIMVSNIIAALGSLLWRPLGAFDLAQAMDSLAMNLFDVQFRGEKLAPLWAAIGSLAVQTAIAVVIIARMVQREAEGSVGGSG
jgi:ABC-type transport system involved in multi-copper enzyme maturation permease subunit